MEKRDGTFILNKNLDFPIGKEPWASLFSKSGIAQEEPTDLAKIDEDLSAGRPLLAYVPGAAFCVMMRSGNQHYRGLVIATSKFTGQPMQRTLLVVRQDDPAQSLGDLEGSAHGYLNRSCSSSFLPPAILLQQKGKKIDRFFKLKQVPGWQSRVDAVTSRATRATMILDDVWKMTPRTQNRSKSSANTFPACPRSSPCGLTPSRPL
jgi:ABC-type phosphate/phosphonate transport system substrate-binding protein